MSASSTSGKIYAPVRQSHAEWSRYALFTLCSTLYLLPFMRIMFAGTDEGTFLCGATRIVHGQVFARDFFEVMGPGSFYWLAAFFKLFGVTFLASRICLFISSLGTALLIYYLSRRVCGQYRILPCLIVAGTYFGGLWPAISHHTDSNFVALLSIFCLVRWHDRPKKSLLIATGVLAGLATCIFQPKGVLLFCACLAWLWFQRRRTSAPLLGAGLLTGGYVTIVALVLAYFWSRGALGSLFYANFVFPRQGYGTVNSVAYSFGILEHYWNQWITAFGGGYFVAVGAILIVPLLFIAVLPALVLLASIRYKWKSVTPEIALYWLCGWALWLSEIHRKDIEHLVFGSPLLIILCIYGLTESRKKLADMALQILAISSVLLAGFNCCTVLFVGAHTMATRVGNVAVLGNKDVIRFMSDHISRGEEVLVYPYSPAYYFLSGTTNPTRYSFLMYNYNTPAQFHDVANVMAWRKVRWVVWDTTLSSKAMDNFPDSQPKSPDGYIVEPYLESHYRLVEDYGGIRIMERKSEAETQAKSTQSP